MGCMAIDADCGYREAAFCKTLAMHAYFILFPHTCVGRVAQCSLLSDFVAPAAKVGRVHAGNRGTFGGLALDAVVAVAIGASRRVFVGVGVKLTVNTRFIFVGDLGVARRAINLPRP